MNVESVLDLYHHMEWADAEVWRAVLGCDEARQDEKLRDSLYHLHVAQRAFLRIWRAEPINAAYPRFERTSELCDWGRTYYDEARSYLEALPDEHAREPIPVAWAERMTQLLGRPPAKTTLADTLVQVPMHSMYHRGQVNSKLRALGGKPPLVDYIAWVWYGRPGPTWDADGDTSS